MKSKTISNQKNNFHELVNKLFLKIEKKINLYIDKIDFDYEIQDYMMSITFLNKSMIIINKQEFLKQIWLATKLNGYHFNYNADQWICNRSNKNFWEIFQKSFSIQSNNNVTFYNI